jgi:hypothetical protein
MTTPKGGASRTKKAAKSEPATRAKKWTEVEDFYLRNNATVPEKDLAKSLKRPVKQVQDRLKELEIDVDSLRAQQRREAGMKGFQVGSANDKSANIVAMTGGRSLQDDIKAGTSPFGAKPEEKPGEVFMERFKNQIARG